jgi:membrane-bound serine protease (ClpP class)
VQLGAGDRQSPAGSDDPAGRETNAAAPGNATERKVLNDAIAYIRSLAELHGRNADWAERAVREAASLSARAAKDTGVVEIIATDMSDLLAQAHGRTVRVGGSSMTLDTAGLAIVALEPDWRMRLLATVTNPNIAYILLLIGIYGIIFEFLTPGIWFPGVIGAVSLLVGLFALNLLPINYAGLALIALGAVLMVAEAFTPSFGLFGASGLAAFAMGSMMLFEGDLPAFSVSLSLPIVVAATVLSAALLVVGATAAVRAHRRRVVTGAAELLGSSGEVVDWAGTHGHVRVHGERWQARSQGPVHEGQRITVLDREGLTLIVRADASQPPPS